jgi:D-aminopeptidase
MMDAPASLRDHGLRVGGLAPGPGNAITDVAGVRAGHVTIVRDAPAVVRTGVTVVSPGAPESLARRPVAAGGAVLNGAGEMTGFLQVSEWRRLETPVYLTATMAVGRVYDGAVAAAMAADPAVGVEDVVIPVVAECDDSWLSDARDLAVQPADAGRALADAATQRPVAQGAVGAGTGMVCFGFKGGIGTASRLAGDHVVGVLVLANFGERDDLRIDGVPVGRLLSGAPAGGPRAPAGSCIAVLATDAPLDGADLARLARRAGLGLARTGSVAHHGSGEIFLAFSTTGLARDDVGLDPLFAAAVEATEEAVLNALWHAETTTGRDGRVAHRLPHDEVLELLRAHRRVG